MSRVCWRPLLFLLCLAAPLLLAASGPPSNVVRADWSFWNSLTPAGRERLAAVPVSIRAECQGVLGEPFVGAVYDGAADTITLCGLEIPQERERIRHEALHALDWTFGFRMSDKTGFNKSVPLALYNQAERAYACGPGDKRTKAESACRGAWFRQGELWAMVPIVAGWDFDVLPAQVQHFYAPWFEGAR
jgi:hypothetical protein